MTTTLLHFQTISELARQLRSGDFSPVALTEHCLARLEALEPTLHAFRLPTPERAMAAALSRVGFEVTILKDAPRRSSISATA